MTEMLDNQWKDTVRPMLEMYSDRMPGSLIEEKGYSLSLHYRRCDPDMAALKINELKMALNSMLRSSSLSIQEGSKVIEIKDIKVNKGYVSSLLVRRSNYDFVFGVGDDATDEDLFKSLPENAFSVKVGSGDTAAKHRIKSWEAMRSLLTDFAKISRKANDKGKNSR